MILHRLTQAAIFHAKDAINLQKKVNTTSQHTMCNVTTCARTVLLFTAALVFAGCKSTPPVSLVTPLVPKDVPQESQPPRYVKGVWLSTVSRLDWPPPYTVTLSDESERIRLQKKSLTDKLDKLAALDINTIFFQVKPDGTALWTSKILPWSDMMTGVIGSNPGYDPLEYLLTEAHRRGMKVHAWFNPYRVTTNVKPATVVELNRTLSHHPASVFVLHRDWIRQSNERYVLDPGIPEVRDWITSIVAEVVKSYPVDGVQFDDYFYTESRNSRLNDDATYQQYGQGFLNKADWRRNNTRLLIEQVSHTIKEINPAVEFGVSPAGVWRNRSDDILGSDTRGAAAYDESYADTRQWVQQGLLDYIAPQLYWTVSRDAARYDVLAKWWAEVVKPTKTRLYIGMALYRVGQPSDKEPDWMINNGAPEFQKQLNINDSLPKVGGIILFREGFVDQPQTQAVIEMLRQRWKK